MTARTSSIIATTAIVSATLLAAFNPTTVRAADDSSLRFGAGNVEPASLTLPANTPVKLHVTNAGDAAVEFESFELHRERVVQPGQTITVYIPALPPGSYPFFDDFSRGAVKGEIVSR